VSQCFATRKLAYYVGYLAKGLSIADSADSSAKEMFLYEDVSHDRAIGAGKMK
jgi:hypothetical protein